MDIIFPPKFVNPPETPKDYMMAEDIFLRFDPEDGSWQEWTRRMGIDFLGNPSPNPEHDASPRLPCRYGTSLRDSSVPRSYMQMMDHAQIYGIIDPVCLDPEGGFIFNGHHRIYIGFMLNIPIPIHYWD